MRIFYYFLCFCSNASNQTQRFVRINKRLQFPKPLFISSLTRDKTDRKPNEIPSTVDKCEIIWNKKKGALAINMFYDEWINVHLPHPFLFLYINRSIHSFEFTRGTVANWCGVNKCNATKHNSMFQLNCRLYRLICSKYFIIWLHYTCSAAVLKVDICCLVTWL